VMDTPAGCVDRTRAIRDTLDTHRLICWFDIGGLLPRQQVLDSVELFAAQVMPALMNDPAGSPIGSERTQGGRLLCDSRAPREPLSAAVSHRA
jgi:hypothetical protein